MPTRRVIIVITGYTFSKPVIGWKPVYRLSSLPLNIPNKQHVGDRDDRQLDDEKNDRLLDVFYSSAMVPLSWHCRKQHACDWDDRYCILGLWYSQDLTLNLKLWYQQDGTATYGYGALSPPDHLSGPFRWHPVTILAIIIALWVPCELFSTARVAFICDIIWSLGTAIIARSPIKRSISRYRVIDMNPNCNWETIF